MNERTEALDGLLVVVLATAVAGPEEDRGATEVLIGRSSGCCLTGVEGAAAGTGTGTTGTGGGGGGVIGRFVAL